MDSDTFTIPIFNLKEYVEAVIIQPLARAILDVNRPITQWPPDYPDGVIKSRSVQNGIVYNKDVFCLEDIRKNMINEYQNYHLKISELVVGKRLKIGLDCHSMLPIGPITSKDPGNRRPLFNLGNCFGTSCSQEITEMLAESIKVIFKIDKRDIVINKPFAGGYITKYHGYNPIPWIQIEMNKSLYLKEPYFNKNSFHIDPESLHKLKEKLGQTMILFYEYLVLSIV